MAGVSEKGPAVDLRFFINLLDTLVGVFVTPLILKSGIDLAFELVHTRNGETSDF
jgi:divalent metal cation (Fe/Co/Zn/Cd) transporter